MSALQEGEVKSSSPAVEEPAASAGLAGQGSRPLVWAKPISASRISSMVLRVSEMLRTSICVDNGMMADASSELGMDEMPAPPSPPSQTQFAAGVAKNLLEEYLAPEKRDSLIKNGLIALGAILFVRFIMNWWTNKIAQKVANQLKNTD